MQESAKAKPSPLLSIEDKKAAVGRLLAAKEASGKTFSQIAAECGLTNVYAAALFYNQQQLLSSETAAKLQKAVPALTDHDVALMRCAPLRRFSPDAIQEPVVYRFYEAVMHNSDVLRALINEEFGDGIMSAIDFYFTVDDAVGKHGERRVVVTMNGKFLPFVEGQTDMNTAQRQQP